MRPVPYLTVMGALICKQTYENNLPCVPPQTVPNLAARLLTRYLYVVAEQTLG
jgi:hypothetical protein